MSNIKWLADRDCRTPKWASLMVIRVIYQRCEELTRETGVEHHVDHIVPLRGRNVCGLHVEYNLQIIPAHANHKKANLFGDPVA